MNVEQIIAKSLESIEAIDYNKNPRQAFIDFAHYNRHLKSYLGPIDRIKALVKDIDSVDWCINEILTFKDQTNYDAYHQSNFEAHKRRMRANCTEMISNLQKLNAHQEPKKYTSAVDGKEFIEFQE